MYKNEYIQIATKSTVAIWQDLRVKRTNICCVTHQVNLQT